MRRKALLPVLAASALLAAPTASAASTIFADVVIDYMNSGAFSTFPAPDDVFGGTFDGVDGDFPIAVPLTYATDGDPTTFVSLVTESFIVLAFSLGSLFDGPGDDFFVFEVGDSGETAEVFVSSDLGGSFTPIGIAGANGETGFDLLSISFTEQVNAIKILALDRLGVAPGFDLAFVRASASSFATIPVPPALPLLGGALMALGLVGARRRRAG